MEPDEVCLICNQQSFGVHFGATACKACSAFFRRSISFNRKYKCYRKGQCKVENRAINCRACRLSKCFKVGMKKELVQNRVLLSSSEASTDIIPAPSRNLSVVEKMKCGILDYANQQRFLFTALYPESDPDKLHMVTYEESVRMERGCNSLLTNVLNDYFPVFCDFDMKLKRDVFRSFSRSFSMFFQNYQTMTTFKDPADWRFLLHHGQVLDCKQIDVFHRKDPNKKIAMRQSIAVGILCVYLIRDMRELQLREIEMAALLGIKLFNEVEMISPAHSKFAESQRNLIYKNLYEEIEKHYYSMAGIRFGRILLLLNYLEPIVNQLMENDALNRIFNVFSVPYYED